MYPQLALRFRGNNKGFVQVAGTGGIVTNAGGYRYHTFIDVSSTFTVTTRGIIEHLVVGGGGGGGHGGGGGAGAVVVGEQLLEAGSYSVTIGGGGSGAGGRPYFSGASVAAANSGQPSVFYNITAAGGIRGTNPSGGLSGNGFLAGVATCGGGGGGSAANGAGYTGGNGILLSDWASATNTGSSGYYAGGGGGSGQACVAAGGAGGLGGGGRGARGSGGDEDLRQDSPTSGQSRTGSGGGAGHVGVENFIRAGASGAAGLVIIRYRQYI